MVRVHKAEQSECFQLTQAYMVHHGIDIGPEKMLKVAEHNKIGRKIGRL